MIIVTRPNGAQFSINPDLLQRIDAIPETVLTLVDGTRYVVQEHMVRVIELVTDYRAALVARAHDANGPRADVIRLADDERRGPRRPPLRAVPRGSFAATD